MKFMGRVRKFRLHKNKKVVEDSSLMEQSGNLFSDNPIDRPEADTLWKM